VFDYLLEKHGHLVLRNAPYHCEYNPIEHIWSVSKNKFNDLITQVPGTHHKDKVIETWEKALKEVTPESWVNSVKHCEKLMLDEFNKEGLSLESPLKVVVPLNESDTDPEEEEEERLERRNLAEEKKVAEKRRLMDLNLERVKKF